MSEAYNGIIERERTERTKTMTTYEAKITILAQLINDNMPADKAIDITYEIAEQYGKSAREVYKDVKAARNNQ